MAGAEDLSQPPQYADIQQNAFGADRARRKAPQEVTSPTRQFLNAIYTELGVPRITARKRIGRCYELAGIGLLRHKPRQWTLVHGTVKAGQQTLGHAWFERGELVYDPVKDFVFIRPHFYRTLRAKAVKRYSVRSAAKHMLVKKSFGPWWDAPAEVRHAH